MSTGARTAVDSPGKTLFFGIIQQSCYVTHSRTWGLPSAMLEFGAQPRLVIGNYNQQPQTSVNLMDLMSTARRGYEAIVSVIRPCRELHTATPNETAQYLHPGGKYFKGLSHLPIVTVFFLCNWLKWNRRSISKYYDETIKLTIQFHSWHTESHRWTYKRLTWRKYAHLV